MQTLAIALGALVLYLVAYHTYGRFLARKIFKLDPAARVPSVEMEDGSDYVPTRKGVIFGHHFTSIVVHSGNVMLIFLLFHLVLSVSFPSSKKRE